MWLRTKHEGIKLQKHNNHNNEVERARAENPINATKTCRVNFPSIQCIQLSRRIYESLFTLFPLGKFIRAQFLWIQFSE